MALPPLAPQNVWQCIQALQGGKAHVWMLEMVQATSSQAKTTTAAATATTTTTTTTTNSSSEFSGSNMFRIPLLNIYVVGNVQVTRDILSDPTTTKHAYFFRQLRYLTPTHIDSFFSVLDQSTFRFKHARKAITQPFGDSERMTKKIQHVFSEWIQQQQQFETSPSILIGSELKSVTTRIICEIIADYTPTQQETINFNESIDLLFQVVLKDAVSNPFRKIFWFLFKTGRQARQVAKNHFDFPRKMLELHRQRKKRDKAIEKKNLIIDMIDTNPNYLNDQERHVDINLLLGAGYETTSSVFSWALYELAKNIPYQRQVRNILRSEQSNNNKDAPLQHSIIKWIVKETLRLYPPVALSSPRVTGREFIDAQSKQVIPKGSTVLTPPFIHQRDPKVYTNPHVFDPSRWENPTVEMMESFLPFSFGRRNCVGMPLAYLELEIGLAMLLHDYEFTLSPKNNSNNNNTPPQEQGGVGNDTDHKENNLHDPKLIDPIGTYLFTLHPHDLWLQVQKV